MRQYSCPPQFPTHLNSPQSPQPPTPLQSPTHSQPPTPPQSPTHPQPPTPPQSPAHLKSPTHLTSPRSPTGLNSPTDLQPCADPEPSKINSWPPASPNKNQDMTAPQDIAVSVDTNIQNVNTTFTTVFISIPKYVILY